MRTFAIVLSALLFAAASASAQVSTIQVIAAPVTNPELGPRTLTAAMVLCTDLPTTTVPAMPYRIVASHAGTNHQQYSSGEIVVLNGGTPQGFMAGQRFFIRRLQVGLNGEQPSVVTRGAIRTAGWLSVVAADEHSALARIDYACDSVAAGDYLDPFVETALPPAALADGPPNFSDLGRVLFGADRRHTFGPSDVLSIDRGKDRGLVVGTRVSFYRDRLNGTPLVEMGSGVVVDVTADSAKVVVVRARDALMYGDYFAIRGAPAP